MGVVSQEVELMQKHPSQILNVVPDFDECSAFTSLNKQLSDGPFPAYKLGLSVIYKGCCGV